MTNACTNPQYRAEHSDYDNGESFEKIAEGLTGFQDASWHNDTCPKLSSDTNPDIWIDVFIDYKDPALREEPDYPEISVWTNSEAAELETRNFTFEQINEVVAYANKIAAQIKSGVK